VKAIHTSDQLKARLSYSESTGALIWLEIAEIRPQDRSWNSRWAGLPALNFLRPDGYLEGHIDRVKYQAHRVAFCIYFGRWPDLFIDHLNGDRADNRIKNMVEANAEGNNCNRRRSRNCASGITGVYWKADKNAFAAQIERGGKRTHLGYFATIEKAAEARAKANETFRFGKNHGAS
jgi:hypothetical protein